MSLKCNARLALLPIGLAGLSLIAAHPAAAQTNLVSNPSFELPVLIKGAVQSNNVITNWTGSYTSNYNEFGVESKTIKSKTTSAPLYPTGIPDGNQFAYVNFQTIYQNIAATTLTPGHTYTLSAYLGIPSDILVADTGSIDLTTAGGTFLAGASHLTSAPGTFTKYTYSFTDTGQYVGQGLQVSLGADGAKNAMHSVDFDNVTLTDTSPAPEPAEVATLSLIGLGLGGLLLRARRRKASAATA